MQTGTQAAPATGTRTGSQTQTLTPVQTRVLAVRAYAQGNPLLARELAVQLVRRDPTDVVAWQVLAGAQFALGNARAAAAAAGRAHRVAATDAQRYDAARLAAEAHYAAREPLRAQFWLRRAVQAAPDPGQRDDAITVFRALRAQSPLSVRLQFGLSPRSNVNGGSASDTLLLNGIPFTLSPDAQALSGLETSLGFSASRRLSEGPRHRAELGLTLSARHATLSDAARAAVPDADADAYDFYATEAFARLRVLPQGASGARDATLTAGRNWYSGAPLSNYARLDLGLEQQPKEGRAYRYALGAERQWRQDSALRSATVLTAGASANLTRPGGDLLRFGAELRDTESDAADIDHGAVLVTGSYTLHQPLAGAEVSLNMGGEWRDYARSAYDAAGRQDLRLSAGVTMFFSELDYLGFAPQVELRATRTQSNISLFDSTDLGLSIGIRSSF